MNDWKLAHNRITVVSKDTKAKSYRSLQSEPSTLNSINAFDGEDSIFKLVLLDKELALVTSHPPTVLSNSFQNDCVKESS
ncbi:hypothetical protein Y032_0384g391 [Ancylostoma ceylanicum]|nr:hypothetical protein Y032_0384g391 [Ancylostoma ceylanicum]